VARFPFDALCGQAAGILHVRCLATESVEDPETGRIATISRFRVLEGVKGAVGATGAWPEVALTLPGGRVGDRRQVVPGIPQFRAGEESVLFLTAQNASGSPWPLGLFQGCYAVDIAETGERRVRLEPGVTPLPTGARYKPASLRPFHVELSAFLTRIRQELTPSEDEP
jgi:hypothetical protein